MPNADQSIEGVRPLDMDDLNSLFAPFLSLDKVLLAVSGGADSLALMVLCHAWQAQANIPLSIHVASVDHGLRLEASGECAFVAEQAHMIGLPHTTLRWSGDASASNLQAKAREARYALLREHARSLSCQHIATAHHLDDQAETFLMRLMRGSGVTGLGAMRPSQSLGDLVLHRPFLDVPKARLVASLKAREMTWVDDPSNHNDDYLRVRVRGLLPTFAQEGCDAGRLGATARRLQRADVALEQMTSEFFLRQMRTEPGRALSFEIAAFALQPDEMRLRLLRKCLSYVSGPDYPPREEGLVALDTALVCDWAQKSSEKRTFGGCCFDLKKGRVWVYREIGRNPKNLVVKTSDPVDWLGLYTLHIDQTRIEDTLPVVRALEEEGRIVLLHDGVERTGLDTERDDCPVALIEALPSVWWNGRPQFVIDWPEVAEQTGARVDFEEKNTKLEDNWTQK